MPVPNSNIFITDLVIKDLEKRREIGIQTYGTPLQAFNGRNGLLDAYEEALDLCVYLRQCLEEDKKENNLSYILRSGSDFYQEIGEILEDAVAELNTTIDEADNSLAVGVRIGKAINQILKVNEKLQSKIENINVLVEQKDV